jgi:hypothetical protein
MKNFKKYLKDLDACKHAIKWVGDQTAQEAWETCERSDWMLWLLDQIEYGNEKTLRLMACEFVRSICHLLKDKRSKQAVIIAEKYAHGKATDKELQAAWNAAEAGAWEAAWVAAKSASWAAAGEEAWVAAWEAAAEAGEAAWAAAKAAKAAALDAGAAERKKQADIIRKYIPNIQELLK